MSRLERGGKCNDPYCELLAPIAEYCDSIRFFGKRHAEEIESLICDAESVARQRVLAKQADSGFDLVRVDREAERLRRRVKGRLFSTAQRMAEQAEADKGKPSKAANETQPQTYRDIVERLSKQRDN